MKIVSMESLREVKVFFTIILPLKSTQLTFCARITNGRDDDGTVAACFICKVLCFDEIILEQLGSNGSTLVKLSLQINTHDQKPIRRSVNVWFFMVTNSSLNEIARFSMSFLRNF